MRMSRPALLFCLCCLIPASLSAQQPVSTAPTAPQPVSDPQAVALIQRSLLALTGGSPVTDVTLTGSARRIAGSDDETGTATLKARSDGSSRLDLSFPSGNRSEVRNPAGTPLADSAPKDLPVSPAAMQATQSVGAWSGPDGVLHGVPTHNLMTDAAWFFPALTVSNIQSSPNYVLSYVGQETLDGASVLHISAFQPYSDPRPSIAEFTQHLTQIDFFLDPTTLQLVALSFNTHPDDNAAADIAVKVLFSGYRLVNGVQVPFNVQKYLNGGLVLDVQLNHATINSGLAASTFAIQ
jgi:hypothetical protein